MEPFLTLAKGKDKLSVLEKIITGGRLNLMEFAV